MSDDRALAELSDRHRRALDRRELLVVSNRQPYRHTYDDGEIVVDRPAGGLTAGLDPVVQRTDGTWIAWGDGDADPEVVDDEGAVEVPPDDPSYTLERVWLSDEAVDDYYYGYSNRVLWPLCHGFREIVTPEGRYWGRYREVNRTFAERVIESVDDRSVVWFQDYHVALAPRMVREQLAADADVQLVHFWHIPWPDRETFRDCPQRRELLYGLLANDLLGFHVERYCARFLECVATVLPEASVDWRDGTVHLDGSTTYVRAFPMGVDVDAIERAAASVSADAWDRFCRTHDIPGDVAVAVGVDRLDYTKGIPERLSALERLFERHPEWRGRLTYVQKATPTRTAIPEYRELARTVDREIDRVNERFGTDDWRPVVKIDEYLSEAELYGLCRYSDLAVVSPLADGMNLVSLEYVAAQVDADGALVLSDRAGAHELLGDAAVSIDPTDTEAFATRLEAALSMSDAERRRRMRTLRSTVSETTIDSWMADVLRTALSIAPADASASSVASNR